MVTLNFASWNLFSGWLARLDGLRRAAVLRGSRLKRSEVVQVIAAAQGDEPRPGIVGLAVLVAAIAIGITMLATGIPAPRATAIDPLAALRAE